ncbi:MAG: hypothetical protein AAGC55_13470, partial [Myxococcota bacterium]
RARERDIRNRYRSIPLALDSSSTDRQSAQQFLVDEVAGAVAVLQKIWIVGLSEPSLAFYQKRYPTSRISTICATRISQLSALPEEGEVLLRGGFYQILGVKQTFGQGMPLRLVEMVMMNTNRDHPSIPQGPAGDAPRKLFDALVTAERDRFCRDYHRDLNQVEDAALYESALSEREAAFRSEYGEPPWLT